MMTLKVIKYYLIFFELNYICLILLLKNYLEMGSLKLLPDAD